MVLCEIYDHNLSHGFNRHVLNFFEINLFMNFYFIYTQF